MIKIISYVVIAFFYRKANIPSLRRWSNILHKFSRRTSPETQTQIWNWLRQRPHRTQAVMPTNSTLLPLRHWWQNSCILCSRLVTTPCEQEMLPTRFQGTAQSEQHWHSYADIEGFICHKLKSINECTSRSHMTKDGRERYVLFFKITSEIKTWWRCVYSFRCCPKGLKHNLECNRCATGDELHDQSFAFGNVKSSEIQFLFISIYLNAMQVIAWTCLEASPLSCTCCHRILPDTLYATLVLVFSVRVTLVLDLYSFALTKNVKLS